eukprot:CAMPEP_0201579874 /NCGR_PEP_ID=MMETSP0190_2-20130828/27763_1 /ASSEMBLY_ACC=CAM_ASM_000263 /TAXON_ID=37353 /ORGANISM="Rosalina sp." /LENGTH=342 /DNA_ID=CAMNT_0048014933 /DNA_START=109 /DNA_END=1137 /DNA_ORIENTATION=+
MSVSLKPPQNPKSQQSKPSPKNKNKKGGYARVENEDSMSKSEQFDSNLDLEDFDQKSKEDFMLTSRWDSRMFDIKPSTPKETVFKLSDYFYEHIDRRTRRLVYPSFCIVALGSLIAIILTVIQEIQPIVGFAIIAGLTLLGAFTGMMGVYRWGSVEDCTTYFASKNNEYEDEVDTLKSIKKKVKSEAKKIHFSVGKLKQHGEELERNLEAFEQLRLDLEKVADKNKDIEDMLTEINKQYDDWQEMIYENEKAHLLGIYFDTSLRDGEHGLTRDEYRRFLGRLNKRTREEFVTQGGFEAMDKNEDGIVDLQEFQSMLDDVFESVNEDELKFLKQRSRLPAGYS